MQVDEIRGAHHELDLAALDDRKRARRPQVTSQSDVPDQPLFLRVAQCLQRPVLSHQDIEVGEAVGAADVVQMDDVQIVRLHLVKAFFDLPGGVLVGSGLHLRHEDELVALAFERRAEPAFRHSVDRRRVEIVHSFIGRHRDHPVHFLLRRAGLPQR